MCTRPFDDSEDALLVLRCLGVTGKTGDLVRTAGVYTSACGFEKTLQAAHTFPLGFEQPTVWGLADRTT